MLKTLSTLQIFVANSTIYSISRRRILLSISSLYSGMVPIITPFVSLSISTHCFVGEGFVFVGWQGCKKACSSLQFFFLGWQHKVHTTVYVPSSELGLSHPLSRQRVCPSPRNQRGGGAHSLAGEGLGESQFLRLEKKLSTLPYTL
jgi:hypothetical protein